MSITRALRLSVALVALSLFAGAASAQEWPLSQAYKCRWSKVTSGVTSYGESTITFQNMVTSGTSQTGNMRTDYPNGTYLNQTVTLTWDYNTASIFTLSIAGGPPMCTVTTFATNDNPVIRHALSFDGYGFGSPGPGNSCTNGATQICVR
jgi:hypothetical protein